MRTLLRGTILLVLPLLLVGGLASAARAAGPVVSSFNPTSGPVGTVVTINGSGFTGVTSVTFNGVASPSVGFVSDSKITASVPTSATSGQISVTANGMTGTSATSFTVTGGSKPQISSFNPTSGPVGTIVTILGSNFTGVSQVQFHNTNASFTVNSDSQITATVPSGATNGTISATDLAGTGTSAGSFTVTTAASKPQITSFSPTSGPVGTSASISGSNFSGVFQVQFHNTNASFTVNSDSQITATVPSGATSGTIKATNSAGTGTSSSSFTVTTAVSKPQITSFSPTSGPVGTSVSIFGSHFTGVFQVQFHNTNASFTVNSDSQITATVPSGATNGTIKATNSAGTGTSSSSFTVTTAVSKPQITSFSPTSGPVGTSVSIFGSHFTGAFQVQFRNTNASFTVVSDGQITAIVPSGAANGTIKVTNAAGTGTSPSSFTVTTNTKPQITSFSPTFGPVGTSVSIMGSNFTGAVQVQFHNTNASFTVNAGNKITATVPAGASSGTIKVTNQSGSATSSNSFTVTGGGGHPRTISLELSGHLIASGQLTATDGYKGCEANLPVVIKRYRHGGWRWVTTTATRPDGTYRTFIRDRQGRYRARATQITLVNGVMCNGDVSNIVYHRRP